jgi:serine/tyrosine/threonine adenylyltransferase
LREYVVSEAMAAMGIPTTRALAAVMTGETVMRDKELPGAVLTRVAASHIRIGTFQYFAARGDRDALRVLLDHVIARHYPEAAQSDKPALAVLEQVIARQAKLIAQWLLVGFIHGVMNTDNMSIAGETIDYGPCAFMDAYDPQAVFSAIDEHGRYAYRNQPGIALWNLSRLAETLLPFLSPDENEAVEIAQQVLSTFPNQFEAIFHAGLRRKIGLLEERPDDAVLAGDLLNAMAANQADFTLTFRRLADAAADPSADEPVRALFIDPTAYDAWAVRWRERLAQEPQEPEERCAAMRLANAAFIPRNHRVEAVIQAATERGDFAPFHELVTVLSRPCDDQPRFAHYAGAPEPHERVQQTFCGT